MMLQKQRTACQRIFRLVVIATILFALGTGAAISAEKYGAKSLNALMAKVWQNCETNLDNLRNCVFNETEVWENNVLGVGDRRNIPLPEQLRSFRREYVWVVRNDYLVRSPVKINGVEISPEERKASEEQWSEIQRYQATWKSILDCFSDFLRRGSEKFGAWSYHADGKVEDVPSILTNTVRGNAVRPKFEPGKYHYSGEVTFQGRKLARIEYVIDTPQSLKGVPAVVDASVGGEDIGYLPGGMGVRSSYPSSIPLAFQSARL